MRHAQVGPEGEYSLREVDIPGLDTGRKLHNRALQVLAVVEDLPFHPEMLTNPLTCCRPETRQAMRSATLGIHEFAAELVPPCCPWDWTRTPVYTGLPGASSHAEPRPGCAPRY